MIGQKDAVVAQVKAYLGNSFTPYKDIALVMLPKHLLESLKRQIGTMIINGEVEYSKDRTNGVEVNAYARSMVMNHLKKARELNGNQSYGTAPTAVKSKKEDKAFSGLKMDILSDELKSYVKTLV